MQAGSDGQACGSCHFHAGADNRAKNQLNPDTRGEDFTFEVTISSAALLAGLTDPGFGPNYTLVAGDFPFHLLQNPDEKNFNNRLVLRDTNDVASSNGVFKSRFDGITAGQSFDNGTPFADGTFNVGGINTRRVEPRNTPSVNNAVFNFANFLDGRAHNLFNGVSVIGPLDSQSMVWVMKTGTLCREQCVSRTRVWLRRPWGRP